LFSLGWLIIHDRHVSLSSLPHYIPIQPSPICNQGYFRPIQPSPICIIVATEATADQYNSSPIDRIIATKTTANRYIIIPILQPRLHPIDTAASAKSDTSSTSPIVATKASTDDRYSISHLIVVNTVPVISRYGPDYAQYSTPPFTTMVIDSGWNIVLTVITPHYGMLQKLSRSDCLPSNT
jgi:hypothetical protein